MHFLTSSINSKSPSYFFFLASATSTQTNTIKRILANSKHCFIMRLSFPAGPPSQQKAVYLFRQKRNAYKTLSLPKRVRDFSRKKNPTRKKLAPFRKKLPFQMIIIIEIIEHSLIHLVNCLLSSHSLLWFPPTRDTCFLLFSTSHTHYIHMRFSSGKERKFRNFPFLVK